MGESGPDWLTTAEVAGIFRVEMSTVARWARRWQETGEVRVGRTAGGPGGHFRFWAADIRELQRSGHDHPAGEKSRDA